MLSRFLISSAFAGRSALMLAVLAPWAGCSNPVMRTATGLEEMPVEHPAELIGDLTQPYGLNYVKVEGISLVTGLDGTGSDPPPTPQRAALVAEMQRQSVAHPAKVLASPDTALVVVRGFLRPGIQKGDPFDVELRIPTSSEATSLRGGWLLPVNLSEMAVLGHQIRSGHRLATAEGPVMVDPSAKSDRDGPLLTRGRVLGGGRAKMDRSLGLTIGTAHKSFHTSKQIGVAINRRFHVLGGNGVAKPKTDRLVELTVHPRYKDNVARYMAVLRNIPLREDPVERVHRMELLSRQLVDPLTSRTAALRLEAIGSQAADVLKEAMVQEDAEVRFYAAEALAYLDDTDAAEPLAEVARNESAFRVHALAALSSMDDKVAYDALRSLLSAESGETRYGAFRALWAMNAHDPLVRGEELGKQFSYHTVSVDGPAMVHVTRSYRPEVVLFGRDQTFQLPMVLDAGPHIIVNGLSGSELTVSRFRAGEPDQKQVVPNGVDDVIRAIVRLGGTYPDVVQMLQQAKDTGVFTGQFRVDALPEVGQPYERWTAEESAGDPVKTRVRSPLPNLFSRGAKERGPLDASGADAGR